MTIQLTKFYFFITQTSTRSAAILKPHLWQVTENALNIFLKLGRNEAIH